MQTALLNKILHGFVVNSFIFSNKTKNPYSK